MAESPKAYQSVGSIVRVDKRLDDLIAADAKIEKLADGFDWSEGPVWDKQNQCLLFSDIPKNTVFKWKEGEGISLYLKPSGYTGQEVFRGEEPGSNGLTFDAQNRLVLCQHGDRRIARLKADKTFETLADRYDGKRFNSPNDAVFNSKGDLYFTDPPYGLPKQDRDSKKELPYCGVFRLSSNGQVTLLTDKMTRPNGIALSPDEKTLYVAQSDPQAPIWMAFEVKSDGTLGEGRKFADGTAWHQAGKKGSPDGLKVDQQGNVYATGPGGVHIFAADGTHLGTLETGVDTANCAWGDDGSTLYLTCDSFLACVRTKATGLGF